MYKRDKALKKKKKFNNEKYKIPLSCAVNKDDDNVCFNFPNVPVLSDG